MERTNRAGRLLRELGRWDLLALVINGIVGAGIFGLPAKVQALLGVYGLWAILACAAIMGLVILCFAEVASRFEQTGGPFVYARIAFGPDLGFLTGWVLWVARLTGCCAICNLLLGYAAYFGTGFDRGAGRAAIATAVIGGLCVLHIFGIRRSALFANMITVAKLIPLCIFVGFGMAAIDPSGLLSAPPPAHPRFAEAVMLLSFAFVGWESVVVTAGETRNPQRDLPFALLVGLACVAILYFGVQLVCMGTLPQLASSERPIVDAGRGFLGQGGATLIVVGAVVAMIGTLHGSMLTISRLPYAMADAGQMPRFLAIVLPRLRTPVWAILVSGAIVLLFTLSSTFVYLLALSTISRLLVFAVSCAAVLKLRRMPEAPPARFRLPGGFVLPGATLVLLAWMLSSCSWTEARDVAMLVSVGAIAYAIAGWRRRRSGA
ncbi:MAG: APC family permease [Steroidobacteraceae bacterium]